MRDLTYGGVHDVQHGEGLGRPHPGPHGRVDLLQAEGQGGRGGLVEDEGPQQGGDGVVADEVGPLGELALEDAHAWGG